MFRSLVILATGVALAVSATRLCQFPKQGPLSGKSTPESQDDLAGSERAASIHRSAHLHPGDYPAD